MAEIAIEMTGQEAHLWRSFQRIVAQQNKMEAGLGRIHQKTKQSANSARAAHQAYDKAFGKQAVNQMRSFAAGIGGVGAAVTTVTSLFSDMKAQAARTAQEFGGSSMGIGSLSQLAESPTEIKKLTEAAKRTFAEGGGNSLDEAAKLVFSLESAGALDERALFSQLKAKNLVDDPSEMAVAAATLIASMGEGETGGFRPLVSKSFGASKFSPSSAESLLEAASRSGGSASALGISDEELLAATAVESKAAGSAEVAGTSIASLLRSLDEKGEFAGLGLKESLAKVQGMNLEGEDLQKYFGRAEAVRAYRDLTANMDTFKLAEQEIIGAEAGDRVSQKLQLADELPFLAADQAKRQAEAQRTLAQEDLGTKKNLRDALVAQRAKEQFTNGSWWPEFENAMNDFVASKLNFLTSDDTFLRKNINEIEDEQLKAQIRAALAPSDAETSTQAAIQQAAEPDVMQAVTKNQQPMSVGDAEFLERSQLQQRGNAQRQLDGLAADGGPLTNLAEIPQASNELTQEIRKLNSNIQQTNSRNAISGQPTLSPPSRDR